MRQDWLRVAHRGASGTAPEHSAEAFRRALQMGVDMIELDVQLSADHALVVMHDLDLDRTTNATGRVREHDLAKLRTLDCGAWFGPAFAGETILTLEEVLELVDGRARLNVEVKCPREDIVALAPRLLSALESSAALDTTIVSCFDPLVLAHLRSLSARLPLGLLWHTPELDEAWRWAQELGAVSFHPHWVLVTAQLMDLARQRGLRVITWTVNDIGTMRELVRMGADGIISDHPERFAEVWSLDPQSQNN